jgi:D-galactarolactone cycloisomerase
MRITGVRTRVIEMPLPGAFYPAWARGRPLLTEVFVLVEVATDADIVGLSCAHAGMEAAISIQRFVAPYLVGRDPTMVEALAPIFEDAEILGPPLYCIEAALWDIIGKLAGLPVSTIWGRFTDEVTVYCSTGEVRSASARVDDVLRLEGEGFRAVKLRFHDEDPRRDMEMAQAVASAVDGRMALMVDANQGGVEPGLGGHANWSFQTALWVAKELRDLKVVWLEEPLQRADYRGLRRLRDAVPEVAIAGGEDNHGLRDFYALIERGCYDILQPDALLSEGVGQIRKVVGLAEAAGLEVTPHNWSNGIGLLVNLHLAATIRNLRYFEFPYEPGSGWSVEGRDQMLQSPIGVGAGGLLQVPDAPGFGIQLDWERVDRYATYDAG